MKKSIGAKTIIFPTPAWLVGSYDSDGKPNAMAAAWGGICCSNPPCVTVSLRKATYSYQCILDRKAYTISLLSDKHAAEVDYFGIVSGKDRNKFADTGLTPAKAEKVDAPYIEEAPLVMECKLIHTHEIGLHTQFIGQIMDVRADESVLNDHGLPDMAKLRPLIYSMTVPGYYGIGEFIGKGYSLGKKFKEE